MPRTALLAKGAIKFREWLFTHNSLSRLDILLNNKRWAFTIHPQYTIALLTGQRRAPTEQTAFKLTGPSKSLREFQSVAQNQGIEISVSSLGNARVVPLLQSQMHADLLGKLRRGIQFESLSNPLSPTGADGGVAVSHAIPHRELDETQQRVLFSHLQGVPVWKGRSFDQYEPHGDEPAGYSEWNEVLSYLQQKRRRSRVFKQIFSAKFLADPTTHPVNHCRIAFRDVTNKTNSRTVIACLVPPHTPLTNSAPYLVFSGWDATSRASVLAVMNSLTFDWLARRYVESHLNYYVLNMLCFPPQGNTPWRTIGKLAARLSCVDERFAEFATEAGVKCGALTYAQRFESLAENDALIARAYDLSKDELMFIFRDFTENAVSPAYRNLVLEKFESL